MKTRNGFVSNSSSSSFVVVGVEVSKKEFPPEAFLKAVLDEKSFDKIKEDVKEDAYDFLYRVKEDTDISYLTEDDGAGRGKVIIGVNVCDSEEYGLASHSESLEDVLAKIKPFLKKLGVQGDQARIQIISGQSQG